MTTRCRENSVTDMRRFFILVLALLLLLTACNKDKSSQKDLVRFLRDDDGYGVTNTESGLHYTALPLYFESVGSGEAVGEYYDADFDYSVTYHQIPGVDTTAFLVDSEMSVWFADATQQEPIPSALTPTALLVCEEGVISSVLFRLNVSTHADVVAEALSLWFEGEATVRPESAPTLLRGIKLVSEELTGIYYCFTFAMYGEDAYFYEIFTGRTVALPAALAAYFVNYQT